MNMPTALRRHWRPLLSLLFGALVYFFWLSRYPYLLLGKESLNLFLFDQEHLLDRLSFPGGMARYISEFLTQFFLDVRWGALVYALLLTGLQRAVWRLCEGRRAETYLLTFIPSISLWYLSANTDIQLTYLVAVVLTTTVLALSPRKRISGLCVLAAATPLVYWLCGPVAAMLPFGVFLRQRHTRRSAILWFAALMLWAALCIAGSWWVAAYPLHQLVQGIGYCFRGSAATSIGLLVPPSAILAVALFASRQGSRAGAKVCRWAGAALCLAGLLLVWHHFSATDYEEIEYDALQRMGMTSHIAAKSRASSPKSTVCQLVARQAASPASGQAQDTELLKALMDNGMMHSQSSAFMLSDLFLKNGLVNKSQHAAFEAMESVWYSKSARALRRLVETNLITGHYAVALKYISLLEETLFYRSWAREMRSLAEHPDQIGSHPVYGPLRNVYLHTRDELFF